jgi:ribosomal protein S18 acetylase RimI-like enzyme
VSVSVRPGLLYDVQTIADFQVHMALETEGLRLDAATVLRGVQAVIDDPSKGKYWVAEDGKQVVGCLLTVPEWSDWRNATVLWIHSVYVLPSARKLGVYRALYERVRQHVEENPKLFRGIRLYVDKGNVAAQEVYTKLGMNGEHYHLYEWMA